jgi:DDE superfamily endonuclease
MMTPLAHPNTPNEEAYNRAHKKTRSSSIECAFGLLKSRFRCLDDSGGILSYSPAKICRITVACAVLHNICVDARLELEIDPDVAARNAAGQANHIPHPPPHNRAAALAIQRRLIDNNQWRV